MALPLRHFLVALGLFALGAAVALGSAVGPLSGRVAGRHLLLAGGVCVTIMGAMTQFVPVWSGVPLHSRRLATWQLRLVGVGLLGFAAAWLLAIPPLVPVFGASLLAGFWTFAYNLGRTLLAARPWDVTERHFALALGFLAGVTSLGLALAVDLVHPVLSTLGLARPRVVAGQFLGDDDGVDPIIAAPVEGRRLGALEDVVAVADDERVGDDRATPGDGVAEAEPVALVDVADRRPAVAIPVVAGDRAHLVADHDDEVVDTHRQQAVEDVGQNRLSGDVDEPFRGVVGEGSKPGSVAGGWNDTIHTFRKGE